MYSASRARLPWLGLPDTHCPSGGGRLPIDPGIEAAAALEAAQDMAVHTAPLSAGLTKKLLWSGAGMNLKEVESFETALHHHLMGHSDAAEGVIAFLERRDPNWSGSVAEEWPAWPQRNK